MEKDSQAWRGRHTLLRAELIVADAPSCGRRKALLGLSACGKFVLLVPSYYPVSLGLGGLSQACGSSWQGTCWIKIPLLLLSCVLIQGSGVSDSDRESLFIEGLLSVELLLIQEGKSLPAYHLLLGWLLRNAGPELPSSFGWEAIRALYLYYSSCPCISNQFAFLLAPFTVLFWLPPALFPALIVVISEGGGRRNWIERIKCMLSRLDWKSGRAKFWKLCHKVPQLVK